MEATAVHEICEAMHVNEASRELSAIVGPLRIDESARSLVSYADFLSNEARDRMFNLISKYPENHAAVMSVLHKTLEWIEAGRCNPNTSAARRSDLDFVEKFAREIARFVLREHLFQRGGK